MVVGSDQLYGRKSLIMIVREFMAREETNGSLHSQRFPILVVEDSAAQARRPCCQG